jgi:hypothetical protein
LALSGRKAFAVSTAARQCFRNARLVALTYEGATYVEGIAFSLHGSDRIGFYHAWITLDGEHAVDPTWRKPGCGYFGIAFPIKQVGEVVRGQWWDGIMGEPSA